MSPFKVVKDFESAVGDYTGAPYVVTTNSCTMALLLAVAWHLRNEPNPHNLTRPTPRIKPNGGVESWTEVRQAQIEIPKRTYVSVPMSIIHAGGWPLFRDQDWGPWGFYKLEPLPVWDCARWFSGSMWNLFVPGDMVCVSFHAAKTLGDTQGGAILLDNEEAYEWLKRARFDGRTEGVPPSEDSFPHLGWHCYMNNDVAARLLLKLHSLPEKNSPLPMDDYPDLSQMEIFR